MATQVQVVNGALRLIGANRVTALDDSTDEARQAKDAWDITRDAILRAHVWNFSLKQAQLAASSTAPVNSWAHSYLLPSDCLKLVELYGMDRRLWTLGRSADDDGTAILFGPYSNSGNGISATTWTADAINIRYVQRITDMALWDPLAIELFEAKLAFKLCDVLRDSDSKKELAAKAMKQALRDAVLSDAIETPPEDQPVDDWLYARL